MTTSSGRAVRPFGPSEVGMGWFRSSTQPEGDHDPSATFEARLASVGPGVPGHCPACDGLGYIDNLDIGHRFQIQHCKDCGHRWEYLFDTEGRVVGLTELDAHGHPVARMRIRARSTEPTATVEAPSPAVPLPDAPRDVDVAVEAEADEVVDLTADQAPEQVIDLREPAPAPAAADQMSAAEWLHFARRR